MAVEDIPIFYEPYILLNGVGNKIEFDTDKTVNDLLNQIKGSLVENPLIDAKFKIDPKFLILTDDDKECDGSKPVSCYYDKNND